MTKLIDPRPDLTEVKLAQLIKESYSAGVINHNWGEMNALKHAYSVRQAITLREQYGLTYDEFNRPIFSERLGYIQLLNDTAADAAQALLAYTEDKERTWQDDSEDYTRAIVSQLMIIQGLLSDDYISSDGWHNEAVQQLERALDYSSEELNETEFDCFQYGFADHGTPLSSIMIANLED